MSKKFLLFIVGIENQLRSQPLVDWLIANEQHLNINYTPPVHASETEVSTANRLSFHHYGSNLSVGEVGCSLAHAKVQEEAFRVLGDNQFVWVFEDDLIPSGLTIERLNCLEKALNGKEPIGVSLYSRNFPDYFLRSSHNVDIDTNVVSLNRGVFPPYTVGYALNRQALTLIAETANRYGGIPLGKADYPVWASSLRWYLLEEPLVGHPDEGGSIADRIAQPFGQGPFASIRLISSRMKSLSRSLFKPGFRQRALWELSDVWWRLLFSNSRRSKLQKPHWK
jgi:GR25 family glycosyltransferase involved in LPS biosynthesis